MFSPAYLSFDSLSSRMSPLCILVFTFQRSYNVDVKIDKVLFAILVFWGIMIAADENPNRRDPNNPCNEDVDDLCAGYDISKVVERAKCMRDNRAKISEKCDSFIQKLEDKYDEKEANDMGLEDGDKDKKANNDSGLEDKRNSAVPKTQDRPTSQDSHEKIANPSLRANPNDVTGSSP